jgi:Tfp pilus assembly protein PilO
MKDKLTPKVVAVAAAVAVALVALIGWFAVVSPQRSKASDLGRQIADAQTQLALAKADARSNRSAKAGVSARLLARAMPDQVAMPQVLRQVQRAAHRAHVRFDGITPQAATTLNGYQAVPMDVVVAGRYSAIQRFLHLLRSQARVAGDRVHASGRLFGIDTVSLAADSEGGLPKLIATIHMNTYVYSGSAATSAGTSGASASSSLPSSATAEGGTP